MPKLEYFAVCESISVDQATNRVSLFNIYHSIHLGESNEGPRASQMIAVACFRKEEGDEEEDHQAQLRVTGPGVEENSMRFNFEMSGSRQRLSFYINGIPAAEEGNIRFDLSLNGDHQAEHIVEVQTE